MENESWQSIVLNYPGSVVSEVVYEETERVNRKPYGLPEPIMVMPCLEDQKNKVLVYCPRGYDLGPFEEKIRNRMYGTAQTTD